MKRPATWMVRFTAALACGVSSGAIAQTSTPDSPEQSSSGIADIVVTAQKRSENLQNVPIAITALSNESLESAGVTDIPSLQIAVPGLSFAQTAGYSLPRIRGVGTTANGPGVENSVAVYIDNVYIASTSAATLAFNNIAQLAVLKGPQGTLFGRNATGGVIQITTLDPGQDAVLNGSVTAANFGTVRTNLYAATPIAEGLAADVAVYYRYQNDGHAHNYNTGNDVGQGRDFSIRSKVKFDPTDTTTIKLIGDYTLSEGTRIGNRAMPGSISIGGNRFLQPKFATQNTFDPRQRQTQKGLSLSVEQGLGDWSVVSITAYRRGNYYLIFDPDTQPAPYTAVVINQFDRQFSHELQLLSPKDGPLTWMAGFYYFNADSGYHPHQAINRTPPFLAPPTVISTTSKKSTSSLAGFGQATLKVSDQTNFTAGLRYTSDRRKAFMNRTITLPNGVVLQLPLDSEKATFNKLTWRLSLDHRFSDELLGYVSYNRGFKSGLFDPTVLPLNKIDPEQLDAYEAGLKANLLDRRLRINAAYFHYIFKNIQIVRFQNGLPTMLSGPQAKIDGIDLDATVRIGSRLQLTGGLSWLNHRITKFPNAVFSTPLPTGGNSLRFDDAAGKDLPMTPDWTLNASATYTIPTSFGEIALDGTWLHNDGYFEGPENRVNQKPFDLLNGSITWTSLSGNVSASLWGKNLLNEFYGTQLIAQPTQDALLWGEPRTYGVTLGFKF